MSVAGARCLGGKLGLFAGPKGAAGERFGDE